MKMTMVNSGLKGLKYRLIFYIVFQKNYSNIGSHHHLADGIITQKF